MTENTDWRGLLKNITIFDRRAFAKRVASHCTGGRVCAHHDNCVIITGLMTSPDICKVGVRRRHADRVRASVAPMRASHTRAVSSSAAVTTRNPSELKTAPFTASVCSESLVITAIASPNARSQKPSLNAVVPRLANIAASRRDARLIDRYRCSTGFRLASSVSTRFDASALVRFGWNAVGSS